MIERSSAAVMEDETEEHVKKVPRSRTEETHRVRKRVGCAEQIPRVRIASTTTKSTTESLGKNRLS